MTASASSKTARTRRARVVATMGVAMGLCGVLTGEPAGAAESALRVCAAANAKPYSLTDESGFENRLARMLGERMNMPVEFVWSERPAIYLEMELMKPGKCDVIMGVDPGDPRMLTTQPYYRSGYAFITRDDGQLDITSWQSPDLATAKVILLVPGSPPEHALRKLGRYDDNVNFIYSLVNFKDRRNQYTQFDPERMVNEVAQGNADVAILWAPEAARYVKKSSVPLRMVLSDPSAAGPSTAVDFHYDQAIGVASSKPALLERLNAALADARSEIEALLREEGIPLLGGPASQPVAAPEASRGNGEKG